MRRALAVFLLAGCPTPHQTQRDRGGPCPDGSSRSTWIDHVRSNGLDEEDPTFRVTVLPELDADWTVDAWVPLENPTAEDCLVAVYASPAPPVRADLPVLSVDEALPEEVLHVGELLAADLVSRSWDPSLPGLAELVFRVAAGPAEPVHLTVIGCPGLVVHVELTARACDFEMEERVTLEKGW